MAPYIFHRQLQPDARDLDIKLRGQLATLGHFETQPAVAHVDDPGCAGVHPDAGPADPPFARPAALTTDVAQAARDGRHELDRLDWLSYELGAVTPRLHFHHR